MRPHALCVLWVAALLRDAHAEAPAWMDPTLSVDERVAALLPKLSIEELAVQTMAPEGLTADAIIQQYGKTGLGVGYSIGPDAVAQVNRAMQNQSRWGIPVAFQYEALHGGCYGGTIFPMPLTMGATWNLTLIEAIYAVIANQTTTCGAQIALAPVINLFTDPRFGRFQEGFSPDPSLSSHYALASVRGMQGDKSQQHTSGGYLPSGKVVSLAKHYVGYGGAAGGLNGMRLDVTERKVRDVYLKPWRYFATVGGGLGAMPSHQTVLDIPMHAHSYLVNDVLREELNFTTGITLSDCNDINVLQQYRIASSPAEAAAKGLIGGVDLDLQCGQVTYNPANIQAALDAGYVTEATLRKTAGRVLRMKFATGMFDNPFPDPDKRQYLDNPVHRRLALDAAEQGTVLLKNTNATLPLQGITGKTVVLAGYMGSTAAQSDQCGPYTSFGAKVVTVQDALGSSWGGAKVAATLGATPDTAANQTEIDAAVALAGSLSCQELGAILFVAGDSDKTCGEWIDRSDLYLPGGQEQLLNALIAARQQGTICRTAKLIGVLISGRPVSFSTQANGVDLLGGLDALLWSGRPGEEGGNAILNVISGKVNPSGRLQAPWIKHVGHVMSGANPFQQELVGKWVANSRSTPDPSGRIYSSYVSDAYGEASPLFPFGWGMSYTSFKYSGLSLSQVSVPSTVTDGSEIVVTATFEVANNGSVAGAEVAQLYVIDPEGGLVIRPWKRLAAFAMTEVLPAGGSQEVKVGISYNDIALSTDTSASDRAVQKGTWQVRVGGSSITDLLTGTFKV